MRRLFSCLVLALALPHAPLAADTATLQSAADTTLFEELPDNSDAKGQGLYTGRITLGFIRRGLVRFDVAGSIPAGSTITSARLDMVVTSTKGNPVDVSLYRATAAWGEGASDAPLPGGSGAQATPGDATWTRRAWPGTSWIAPGGDTAASPSATSPISTALASFSFGPTAAMTANVQSWLDLPATNFGWQLRADELQASPSARRWATREAANAAQRPVLTVVYDPPPPPPTPTPAPPTGVPASSSAGLAALGVVLALLGALALRKG
jgi:hypothetical protein